MSLQPSSETLKESFKFGHNDDIEIQFHNLHKDNPLWENILTPIFINKGETFFTYDTLWSDIQEVEEPESIARFIVNRFNIEFQKISEDNEPLSWSDALLLFFRTSVIYSNGRLSII